MRTGRTTYRDDILEQKPGEALASCPSPSGGHNWQATSYDPANDFLMIPLSQNCAMYGAGGQLFYEMPGTDGNLGRLSMPSRHLWGWLLDEHDVAGQGVPQKGPWFLQPFAVKAK